MPRMIGVPHVVIGGPPIVYSNGGGQPIMRVGGPPVMHVVGHPMMHVGGPPMMHVGGYGGGHVVGATRVPGGTVVTVQNGCPGPNWRMMRDGSGNLHWVRM